MNATVNIAAGLWSDRDDAMWWCAAFQRGKRPAADGFEAGQRFTLFFKVWFGSLVLYADSASGTRLQSLAELPLEQFALNSSEVIRFQDSRSFIVK